MDRTPTECTLEISAIDGSTGLPVSPFRLRLEGRQEAALVAHAGPSGSASVPVGPGVLKVVVNAPGYRPTEETATMLPGVNRMSVTLSPAPFGTVEGVVRLTAPRGRFMVHLDGIPYVFDDPQGRFRIPGARVGRKLVGFARADFRLFEEQRLIEVKEGETTYLDVSLARPGTIAGTVANVEGRPIAGALVQARSSAACTDASGSFTLVALQPGEHRVRVVCSAFDATTEVVHVDEGLASSCRLTLQARGRLSLSGRAPHAGTRAVVLVFRGSGSEPFRITRTGDGGSFEFHRLEEGEYRLRCLAQTLAVHVGPGDVTGLVMAPSIER